MENHITQTDYTNTNVLEPDPRVDRIIHTFGVGLVVWAVLVLLAPRLGSILFIFYYFKLGYPLPFLNEIIILLFGYTGIKILILKKKEVPTAAVLPQLSTIRKYFIIYLVCVVISYITLLTVSSYLDWGLGAAFIGLLYVSIIIISTIGLSIYWYHMLLKVSKVRTVALIGFIAPYCCLAFMLLILNIFS